MKFVPECYQIRVPKLVLDSKTITWHGHTVSQVTRNLKESLCDGNYENSIRHMVELVGSGYITEFWNIIWETFLLQGLGLSCSSLYLYLYNEYKALNNLKSKLSKAVPNCVHELVNTQIFRNHISEIITLFSIINHRPLPQDILYDVADIITDSLLEKSKGKTNLAEKISEPIKESDARSLAREYILMTKTESNTCVQLEEIHYNLAKFIEAANAIFLSQKTSAKKSNLCNIQDSHNCKEEYKEILGEYSNTFFWVHELVKMSDITLKPSLQNYLPREREDWMVHPSNIVWNYLFIRAPDSIWPVLNTLMDIYTLLFQRKQLISCSSILQTALIIIRESLKSVHHHDKDKYSYIRSRHPMAITNVMRINELISSF
jgi:hypothetical protein